MTVIRPEEADFSKWSYSVNDKGQLVQKNLTDNDKEISRESRLEKTLEAVKNKYYEMNLKLNSSQFNEHEQGQYVSELKNTFDGLKESQIKEGAKVKIGKAFGIFKDAVKAQEKINRLFVNAQEYMKEKETDFELLRKMSSDDKIKKKNK